MAGRIASSPPSRTPTMSSLFRRGTSQGDKSPEVELREVLIPKYELEWATLKAWLDGRFKSYNCSFTKRYNVSNDKYVVYLPEDLTDQDEVDIAMLKSDPPRGTGN